MSEQEVIARLYRQIKDLEEQKDAVVFTFNQADAECARLRALLTRATDALDRALPEDWYPYGLNFKRELRKAAK